MNFGLAAIPCLNSTENNGASVCLRGQRFNMKRGFGGVLIYITILVVQANPFVFIHVLIHMII